MQDFLDNEKKTIKSDHQSAILDLISAKFVIGYLCVSPYILFYKHGPSSYFALFLRCVNITKLLKFKMAARPPFLNCLLPKVNQVIGWHSCACLPNKIAGNIFLKRANKFSLLVALITKGWLYGIKMSQKIPRCYLMTMWSMRKQKFIHVDQLLCNIFEISRKK